MRDIKTVSDFATVAKLNETEVRKVLAALGARNESGRRMFSRSEIDAILDDAVKVANA